MMIEVHNIGHTELVRTFSSFPTVDTHRTFFKIPNGFRIYRYYLYHETFTHDKRNCSKLQTI